MAESLGVHQFADGKPPAPLALTGAYAALAGRGLYCPPVAVTTILDSSGQADGAPAAPQCSQELDQGVADTISSVLRGVIDGRNPGRTGRTGSIGRAAAGKTGTTNSSRAAWFAGYTPDVATTVWVGRPVPVAWSAYGSGRYYGSVYGGTLPARIWRQAMLAAVEGKPHADFAPPPGADGLGRADGPGDYDGRPGA